MKRIVVHLDGGSRAEARLELGLRLAARLGAQLVGLFADGGTSRPPAPREVARTLQATFEQRAQAARLGAGWWQVDGAELEPGGIAARYARYADLAIVGQYDPDESRVPADFASRVLLESGRPVLVVPYTGSYPDAGRRPLIAWDGTREAARALGDALPLLAGAEKVHVALLRSDAGHDSSTSASVLSYLAAHGIQASSERVVLTDGNDHLSAADAVLNVASDANADLMVVGARGSHGVPFPRAARGTRASLAAMTAPVLLST